MIKILKIKQYPIELNYRNTILLKYDNWDDYGYKTTYRILYVDDKGEVT